LFLCEGGPYGRRPITKMWCNTRTLSSKGKPFLDWSLVTISPSNHVTHGDSPAAAPGQKQGKRQ
jgi:hypothetical protein